MVVFELGHTRIMKGGPRNSDNAKQKKRQRNKYAEGEGQDMYDTRGEAGRAVHSTLYRQTRRTGQGYVAGNTLFSREISRRK